jgi:hypothetical protein
MSEMIEIEVPRRGIGSDLTEALGAHGLHAEIIESGDSCALRVRFADDERERLLLASISVIEGVIAERTLPLVVQRGNGGCIVRPPAD